MRADLGSQQQRAEYFVRQIADNDEFFARFGREPDYTGRRVLDLGCGDGAMTVRVAERGAREVVGLDIDRERLAWAEGHVARNYPGASSRISFIAGEITDVDGPFDLVIAKDTVEHIADVEGTLRHIRERLAVGGEVWLGFSPLYYSPFGDHRRTGMRLPWGHVLPWPFVRLVASRYQKRHISARTDIGLNGLTPRGFRRAVTAAGFQMSTVAYNRGEKPLLRVLRALRRFPGAERYATVSIYATLR